MIFAPGDTSKSLDVLVVDDTGLPVAGLVAATMPAVKYSLAGANADATIALSDLATLATAWAAGGFKERGEGRYRLDLPNAALAAAGAVTVRGEAAGKRVICEPIAVGVLSAALADAVAHGGASATLTFSTLLGVSGTKNNSAVTLVGNGTAPAVRCTGGATGNGAEFLAGASGAYGVLATGGTDGVKAVGIAGNGATLSGGVYGMGLVGVSHGLDSTTAGQIGTAAWSAADRQLTAIDPNIYTGNVYADLQTVFGETDPADGLNSLGNDYLSAGQVAANVTVMSTTVRNQIATAWGARVLGDGRTADMFLQGGTNKIAFAADGLSWVLYSTDDATALMQGSSGRLATDVGGLRSVDPA